MPEVIEKWNNAHINLHFFAKHKGITNFALVQRYRAAIRNNSMEVSDFRESDLRRMRRLRDGTTKITLRDLFLLSEALKISPEDLAFLSPKEFKNKYAKVDKNSCTKNTN